MRNSNMPKTSPIYGTFVVLAIIFGLYACKDDTIGLDLEIDQISRLYVSFEEYESSGGEMPDTNLRVIQPADSSVFAFRESIVSSVEGGGAIYFNPYLRAVFQASVNASKIDTGFAVVEVVRTTGLLNNIGMMESRYYNNVKGFVYQGSTTSLLVVNGAGDDAGIYMVDQPRSGGGNKQPWKKLRNPDLDMWGAAFYADRLFTSKLNAPVGLYVFENITTIPVNPVDSVATLHPTRTVEIRNATNLRGLSYDTIRNVMAIADFGDGETLGTGRILIFDNFSSLINGGGTITPTRVITGTKTGLIEPVDVALDMREAGEYLYVADRTAEKVIRFRYTDNGDVEPDKVIDTSTLPYGRKPVGLSLDARDHTSDPNYAR